MKHDPNGPPEPEQPDEGPGKDIISDDDLTHLLLAEELRPHIAELHNRLDLAAERPEFAWASEFLTMLKLKVEDVLEAGSVPSDELVLAAETVLKDPREWRNFEYQREAANYF